MTTPLEQNNILNDNFLKSRRLVYEFAIVADATPADKTSSSDIPGIDTLRLLGITAAADAIEDLSAEWTTPVDATNAIFGVLLDKAEIGDIKKVLSVTVVEVTATGTAIAAATPGAVVQFLSAGKNIAIEITATGTSLTTESPTIRLEIEYIKNS